MTEHQEMQMTIALVGMRSFPNVGDTIICDTAQYIINHCDQMDYRISKVDLLPTRHSQGRLYYLRCVFAGGIRLLGRLCWGLFGLDKTRYVLEKLSYRFRLQPYFIKSLKGCNAIIFAGGGFIKYRTQDLNYAIELILEIAQHNGTPVMMNAMGIEGYIESDERCQQLKRAMNLPCVKTITTRDDIVMLQKKYITNTRIMTDIVGDPAFWIPECYGAHESNSSNMLGIGVIYGEVFLKYGGSYSSEKLLQFYQQLILEVEARGIPWMMFSNGLETDQNFGEQILHSLGIPVQQKLLPRVVNDPEKYIKRVASFRSIFGARLHACITAYSLDISVAGLIWNPKLDLFAQITKQRDYYFDETELDAKTVVDAIQRSRESLLDTSTRENLKKKTMLYIAAFLDNVRKEQNMSFRED